MSASCSSIGFLMISTSGGMVIIANVFLTNYQILLRIVSRFLMIYALYTVCKKITSHCNVRSNGWSYVKHKIHSGFSLWISKKYSMIQIIREWIIEWLLSMEILIPYKMIFVLCSSIFGGPLWDRRWITHLKMFKGEKKLGFRLIGWIVLFIYVVVQTIQPSNFGLV